MKINKNSIYLVDGDITYLCIGFTERGTKAILAPYWSDDEDSTPDIQDDEYMVVSNPYNPFDGWQLEEIGTSIGKVELVWAEGHRYDRIRLTTVEADEAG